MASRRRFSGDFNAKVASWSRGDREAESRDVHGKIGELTVEWKLFPKAQVVRRGA